MLTAFSLLVTVHIPSAWAGDARGITQPIVLPPYDEHAPACSPPPGLERVLAFARENQRKFMQGVAQGLPRRPVIGVSPSA